MIKTKYYYKDISEFFLYKYVVFNSSFVINLMGCLLKVMEEGLKNHIFVIWIIPHKEGQLKQFSPQSFLQIKLVNTSK